MKQKKKKDRDCLSETSGNVVTDNLSAVLPAEGTGTLWVVPTPVGNLSDMTPRALEILRGVSLIMAEDTRTSAVLMRHFGIATPMAAHHKFNEHTSVNGVVERLLAGEDIALVSDAGTPGISDPGFLLSRECRRNRICVRTLPGATAFVPALVDSGLPCERFVFEGFLPVRKGRAARLEAIASSEMTSVVYESPVRLARTLHQLAEACGGDREASVSREISKIHESTARGTLAELAGYFDVNLPKGEIVIVVSGKNTSSEKRVHVNKYSRDDSDLPTDGVKDETPE